MILCLDISEAIQGSGIGSGDTGEYMVGSGLLSCDFKYIYIHIFEYSFNSLAPTPVVLNWTLVVWSFGVESPHIIRLLLAGCVL